MYLHQVPTVNCLRTSQTKSLNFNQSQLFRSITCFSKIDLQIEHVLIGVENQSRCRVTHVPKIGAGFRSRVSSA